MGFDCDIAVVGAGLAGLMAADRLRQADIDVIVLEGRNRPGGAPIHAVTSGASRLTSAPSSSVRQRFACTA